MQSQNFERFLTLEKVEEQLKDMDLKFMFAKSAEYEKLPPFIGTFRYLVSKLERLPTQEEFIEEYMQTPDLPEDRKAGVEARARRSYPSLVREIHMFFLLQEEFGKENVAVDADADVNFGIDMFVKYNKDIFFIHSFVDTKRSREFRDKKNNRHEDYPIKGYHVDFTTSNKTCKEVGKFWLYSKEDVRRLKQSMKAAKI